MKHLNISLGLRKCIRHDSGSFKTVIFIRRKVILLKKILMIDNFEKVIFNSLSSYFSRSKRANQVLFLVTRLTVSAHSYSIIACCTESTESTYIYIYIYIYNSTSYTVICMK